MVDAATLLCEAPPLPPSERNNSRGYSFDAVTVEVTINGQLWASTAAGAAAFTYAWDDAVRVSSTYPAGAPRGGGTDHAARRPARPGRRAPGRLLQIRRRGLRPRARRGQRRGRDRVRRPQLNVGPNGGGAACAAAVTIEVTINGDNPAGGAAMYAGDDGARFQIGDVEGWRSVFIGR